MQIDVLVTRAGLAPNWIAVDAANARAAEAGAIGQGYAVLQVRKPLTLPRFELRGHTKRFDIKIFCAQLGALLQAGLSLPESLAALSANARDTLSRLVLNDLIAQISRGKSLAQALGEQPASFPPLFIAMIGAAERTSGLALALGRYREYIGQVDQLRAKLRAAAVYPLFLLVLGTAVLIFLLTYVVPRFAGAYESARGNLPWAAQLMLGWGRWASANGTLLWGFFALLLLVVFFLATHRGLRGAMVAQMAQLPGIASLIYHAQLARLYRTISMLLSGGIPISAALADCVTVLPAHLRRAVDSARAQIAQGVATSTALADAGVSTSIAHSLLVAGERSGRLANLFEDAAKFLELESGQHLDQLMRVMEPALMAAIGLAIGVIVVLMYLPIFELAGSLQWIALTARFWRPQRARPKRQATTKSAFAAD